MSEWARGQGPRAQGAAEGSASSVHPRPLPMALGPWPLAPAIDSPHARTGSDPRLEPGGRRVRLVGLPRRAERRDAAGRASVSVRDRSGHRRQEAPPAPHGGSRHRVGRHWPPRRGAARARRHARARQGDRERAARPRSELRGAHRDLRRRARGAHIPGGGDTDRGGDVHRLVAHPAVRGRLDARARCCA